MTAEVLNDFPDLSVIVSVSVHDTKPVTFLLMC